MKKSSKRILVSVLTLVLTVVALTTTTFAWFSLSGTVSVNGIEGNIQTVDGLEVALKIKGEAATGKDFQSNLSKSHFDKFITGLDDGFTFSAVTTTDNSKFTKLDVVDGNLTLDRPAESNEDYLEFDLVFRSKTAGRVLLESFDLSGDDSTFNPEVDYVQYEGQVAPSAVVNTSAKNAARLSLTSTADIGYNAYQAKEIANYNSTNNEPVEYGQWAFLQAKGVHIYESADTKLESFSGINLVNAVPQKDDIVDAEIVVLEENTESGYFQGKTTVRIWIEGWDADTYDSVFGLKLEVAMTFRKEVIQ